jgi:NTE family protein
MDGGIRSGANADLAEGCARVVVLAPMPRSFGPMAGVAGQVEQLRRTASEVALVTPDAAATQAFGRNVLDPAARSAAARAGMAQAASVLATVREAWG